ncbi:cyclodehydratase [Mycobacterium sp. OTB74]|uniref:cyclodehydratase n=1 Tax=Mycobacterium sp. OTB74 TaxID=1853452 RepID=UPI002475DCDD|nr:cyclodehydratase [Mycobacterium sp. OTB74]MDH6242540.1 hypothetical protein [Mycobacterium sp. OTB74]
MEPVAARHTLNPAMPVLRRPDDTVQIGWDPRRAVVVRPPADMSIDALTELLRAMQSGIAADDLETRAVSAGLTDLDALTDLISALAAAGLLHRATAHKDARAAVVRVHGSGPLSDLLASALSCSGNRVRTSRLRHVAATRAAADLVVLADTLVADPRLVRELQAANVPHLPVRIRDGTGLIGPLVLPGVTSCLHCAKRDSRAHRRYQPSPTLTDRSAVAQSPVCAGGHPPPASRPTTGAHRSD